MSKIPTYQAGIMQSATHRLVGKVTAGCLKSYNLTMMEWFAYGYIYDNQRIRISELSKELNFTMPYATNLVNSLEAKGYVSRVGDEADSRSKPLELTKLALEKYKAIERELRSVLRKTIYSKVSPEDFKVYIKVIYELGSQIPPS